MRTNRLGRLLSAAVLAMGVAMPVYAAGGPENTDNAVPPVVPAAINAPAPPAIRGTVEEQKIDAQVADRLHAIIVSGQFDKRIDHVLEREAMAAFYAARNYAPLWIADGKPGARAKAVIAQLGNAAADGLDSADYPVPAFGAAKNPEALADADLTLTYSALLYARHLAAGRIAPARAVNEVDYPDHAPAPADVLKTLMEAADTGAALESFNPPHRGFLALKTKLAELRSAPSERVEISRSAKGRHADRAAPGVSRQAEINTVIANMERWRWLPRDLGDTYVMVNIPDYTLKVVHDGQEVWHTKIVVGKPDKATPLLTAQMDNVLVNPSWHVPQSIIKNEFLPRYGRDPNIFARMGLEVKHNHDGTLSVTQPPGAGNALGRIKFNFPNQFSVYLHDTPTKRLFAEQKRAFSHGCMRVENPTRFGEIMLHLAMNGPTPDADQLEAMFGRGERTFKLTGKAMVHLTYQTAFVDDAGKLQLREDIYGLDERIHTILQGDERRIADLAPARDGKDDQENARANQIILGRVERAETADAFAYFDNIPDLPPPREPRHVAARVRPQRQAAAGVQGGFQPQTQPSFPFWPFSAGR